MKMKSQKGIYVYLWFVLIIVVGVVWLFGGTRAENKAPATAPIAVKEESSEVSEVEEMNTQKREELVGLWIPYMSLTAQSREEFEDNYKRIADSASEKGINALFVHIRPFSDALYPSEYFPWSHILTGEQGRNPNFDPLEFMLSYTHELGIEFHAWINPLRVKLEKTPQDLADTSPYIELKRDNPYFFMEYEGQIFLNPAYPEMRRLIMNGVREIVRGYDVDGIHFDDYFYPTSEAGIDAESYELYRANTESPVDLALWRKSNIDALVSGVYRAVKEENKDVVFGISPQGNIENNLKIGADVETWCAVSGYIDYICPQIYFSFGNEALGFSEALDSWVALQRHGDLKIYIGLALYKAGTDADGGTWLLSDDNISRQISAAREKNSDGIILYSSQYLDISENKNEVENAVATILEEVID